MQQVTKTIRECLRSSTWCMSWLWLSMYWHDMVHSRLSYTKRKPDQVRTTSITKCFFWQYFWQYLLKTPWQKKDLQVPKYQKGLCWSNSYFEIDFISQRYKRSKKIQWGLFNPIINMLKFSGWTGNTFL